METPWWISVLVSWAPFVTLVLLWLIIARWGQTKGPWARIETELQRMNALQERIALALEKRAEK